MNQVFIPYWSKDMLHELIVDIDEILNLSLDEADILVNKMVEGGICEKEDTYTRLNVIKGVAVQALKMK